MTNRRLFHIAPAALVDAAHRAGEYRPQAFAREGFIHCSYEHQVVATANRIFRGHAGLVLLEIDPAAVAAPLLEENLEGGTQLYPHIYGAVPVSAIRAVHDFPCDRDGFFSLPAAVRPA